MVIAAGVKRIEILAAAGLRDCVSCYHTTMHFVVGEGEQHHSVEDSGLERTKLVVCDICRHVYPLMDQEPLEFHE